MPRITLCAFLAACGLAACGGGGPSNTPVGVAGDWFGTWQSGGSSGTATLGLTQQGTIVTGELALFSLPCGSLSAGVGGILSHEDLPLSYGDQGFSGEVTLTFSAHGDDPDSLDGTFTILTGICAGATGTLSVVREQPVTAPDPFPVIISVAGGPLPLVSPR
jgi:hypothetical protein